MKVKISCPACLDRLATDDYLRESSTDVIVGWLAEYHSEDHNDSRKSPTQLSVEEKARDQIARNGDSIELIGGWRTADG